MNYGIELALLLVVTSTPAHAQFVRQAPHPRPNVHQPTKVAFAGPRGFITGMNNFPFGEHVLSSADAGRSWSKAFDAAVTTVHFADAVHGWMVGDAASRRTTDGGVTWQPMASFPKTSYRTLRSLSPTFVWAMNTPWASGYPLMISDDGGVTWRAAQVGNEELRIGDFITPSLGIGVTANGIARSTDGGHSWSIVDTATLVQDIRFLSSSVVIAIRDAGLSRPGDLLRSVDGGQTWSVAHSSPALGRGDDLVPIDGTRCLAAAGTSALRTVDAGRTWQPVPALSFGASASAIVHVGVGRLFASSSPGQIFRSLDAGATWTEVFPGYGAPFNDFAFADANVGIAAGNYGGLVRTTDGGQTWSYVSNGLTLQNFELGMWDRQRGIVIVDQGFKLLTKDGATWIPQPYTSGMQQSDVAVSLVTGGFAATIGANQVHVTTDFGKTWTARTPVNGYKNDVVFLTPFEGWVVGDAMRIEHTANGGQTWTTQHEQPVRNTLYSLDMIDVSHGWVSGSGGAILKTTDGRTWQGVQTGLQHSGANNGILLDFVTADHGWIVGAFGFIALTKDGGRTWTDRSFPSFDESVFAVCAVSTEEAYVATWSTSASTARLLLTKDEGRTWQQLWSGTDTIAHIERSEADELWLCGERGLILHRDPGGAFVSFGSGCSGAGGHPTLGTNAPPRLGSPFVVQARNFAPSASLAVLLLGTSRSVWGTVPLPLDLAGLGMPGCALRVAVDILGGAPAQAGAASWSLQVPASPGLLAAQLHLQALAPDAAANVGGIVLSNAATAWIGR